MKFNSPQNLPQLAALLRRDYLGDKDILINGVNEIHCIEAGDVTFADHRKYVNKAWKTAASVLILKAVDVPENPTKGIIISENPFDDFNYLLKYFQPFLPSSTLISPSAQVGQGTIIQPGTFVGNHVKIGDNCLIHSNVSIADYTEIGNNVIIHAGSVIGADAFYYKRKDGACTKLHSGGNVIIEDDVEIGALCSISKGASSSTIVGKGTKIDCQVHIGHDTKIGKNCLFAAQVGIAGVVTIEDDVILWGQVGVQKDLTIGKGAVVLGQSGIAKSLAGNTTYFGSPVREARDKMKELALIKQLPSIIKELKS